MKLVTLGLLIVFLFQLSCTPTKDIYRNLSFLDQFPENSFRIVGSSGTRLIIFRKSNYIIKSQIKLPSDIIINGNGSTFYNHLNEDADVINLDNVDNVTITNSIFSTRNNISSKSRFYFSAKNSSRLNLDSISFINIKETAIHLTDVYDCSIKNTSFINLQIHGKRVNKAPSIDGIFLGGYRNSSKIQIENCSFQQIGNQEDFNNRKNDGDGIHIQAAPNSTLNHIVIEGCYFKLCSSRAVKIQSGDNIEIKDNTIDSCTLGISFALAHNVNQVIIENNKMSNCNNAISSYSSNLNLKTSRVSIKENKIENAQYFIRNGLEMSNFVISDNLATNIGRCFISGMFENGNISKNTIGSYATDNNRSFDMAIHLTKKSSKVEISKNIFKSHSDSNRGILLDKNTNSIIINDNIFDLPPKMIIHFDPNNKSHKILKNRSINHR